MIDKYEKIYDTNQTFIISKLGKSNLSEEEINDKLKVPKKYDKLTESIKLGVKNLLLKYHDSYTKTNSILKKETKQQENNDFFYEYYLREKEFINDLLISFSGVALPPKYLFSPKDGFEFLKQELNKNNLQNNTENDISDEENVNFYDSGIHLLDFSFLLSSLYRDYSQ